MGRDRVYHFVLLGIKFVLVFGLAATVIAFMAIWLFMMRFVTGVP
jgi:hypothetical protein